MFDWRDLGALVGGGLLVAGAWMLAPWAGFVTAGSLILGAWLIVALARGRS